MAGPLRRSACSQFGDVGADAEFHYDKAVCRGRMPNFTRAATRADGRALMA